MPNDAIASQPYLDIEKLKIGDPKSFQRLYQLLYSDLIQKAASLLKEEEAATAAVNHGFIKCWLRSEALTSMNYISAFLTTTVRNNCMSSHDDNGFRSTHYSRILEAVLSDTTRNGLSRTELLSSLNSMRASELHEAKAIFSRFYDRRMAVADIARETGIASQTADKGLSIAFQALHLVLSLENI